VTAATAAAAEDDTAAHALQITAGGLPRGSTVGVLGGGQLGRMLALAAAPLGIKVRVLDPTEGAPASVAAEQVVGSFRDKEAVLAFAAGCDVVTVEIEHVDVGALEELVAAGVEVQPLPATIAVIQDKCAQKAFFAERGVPVPDFVPLATEEEVAAAAASFGYPLMLKSRRDAYDGRGNAVARSAAELPSALATLGGLERGLYAERWAPFERELAVMVARARDGSLAVYDVVETTHRDSICDTVFAPAQVPEHVREAARAVAAQAVAAFDGAGIFGVELFLLPSGEVLLNEVAPRVHNSGHHTIEACTTSQFEQCLRAVLGWPLGEAALKVGGAAMKNILGEAEGPDGEAKAQALVSAAIHTPGASVHWYGKAPAPRAHRESAYDKSAKPKRKLGHVTVVASTPAEAQSRLETLEALAEGRIATPAPETRAESSSGLAVRVGIIMGSDSDLPCMSAAAEMLESFGIGCEVTVVSAHRTPDRMLEYARSAAARGVRVLIAGAGGAAHLPGMVAALTPLPVIGVPVPLKHFDGLDSMLSIVQMPKGVPVATVAVGNAANAGLLAVRVLAAADPILRAKMQRYQTEMEETVLAKADKLETKGYREYLEGMTK